MSRYCVKQIFFGLLILAGFVFPVSCKEDAGKQIVQQDSGIRKAFEKGPLQVLLATDKSAITIAERLSLSLTVTTDENDIIQWPSVDRSVGQFRVLDESTTLPELVGKNRKKIVRTYVLEPFLAGEYVIPSLNITIRKTGADNQGINEIVSVETDQFFIPVKSVLPDANPARQPHDIKPPVEIPGLLPLWGWLAIIGACLAAIAAAAIVVLRKRRKRQDPAAIILAAHEIALRELAHLAVPMKMDRMEIKLFYQKISDILRRYIENRFGVNAPEQTTEEFLAGMDFRTVIEPVHKPLLRNFLAQCDLVKFAEHNPAKGDIDESLEKCKEFINQTKREQYS